MKETIVARDASVTIVMVVLLTQCCPVQFLQPRFFFSFVVRVNTLGQKSTFYPEITQNLVFENCEFCEKRYFEIVNFVKNETLTL